MELSTGPGGRQGPGSRGRAGHPSQGVSGSQSIQHGGHIRRLAQAAGIPPEELLDFSASINPLGPPPWLRDAVMQHLGDIEHYPDPECGELVEAISARYGVSPERVVVGNGSAEIIAALPRVLPVRRALIPVPTYVDYAVAVIQAGLDVDYTLLEEEADFALDLQSVGGLLRGGEAVFVGRPNNPTGMLCSAPGLAGLATQHPDSWLVVDEAFIEFVEEEDRADDGTLLHVDEPNLIVLRSLTKLFAIPGLRLGFAVVPSDMAPLLRRTLVPWSVNALAQAVGVAALADIDYVQASRAFVREERRCLAEELAALPALRVFPGRANYLLVKVAEGPVDARELARRLLRRGIAIRVCDNFDGLDGRYFRVAVRRVEENARLIEEIRPVLASGGVSLR